MPTLHALAPAKINVFLRIVGRRSDGYHFLDSLMIPISLYDEVQVTVETAKQKTEGGASRLVLTCDDPTVPNDTTNLAYKAAALLLEEAAMQVTASVHLKKKIPAGAGLGGGSSDAAAVLKSLNALLQLGFSEERLCRLGARLGADVPFFIPCRSARVTGIGEIVTPVPPLSRRWLVLVAPFFAVSTPWAYQRFDELPTASVPASFALEPGVWPSSALLVNDLERAVLPEHPQIAAIKSTLLNSAADGALMSGSGSSVFGIFQDRAVAINAMAVLQEQGRVFLVEPLH
ncbi:MAG: 4-(cytidine 5'-diphospho)-2-C-methyl-D-erythritol kinase [Candidatus Binatia bacterium]